MTLLTPQQEEFCQHFAVHRSTPAAYRHAYNVGPETKDSTVASSSSRMLNDHKITARIHEIQWAALTSTDAVMTLAQLKQLYFALLHVDPNELASIVHVNCRHCWGDDGAYQWDEGEYYAAIASAEKNGAPLPDCSGGFGWKPWRTPCPECEKCDGRGESRPIFQDTRKLSPGAKFMLEGVKVTRNGIELQFMSKEKALESVGRLLGAFNDRVTVTGQVGIAAALATLEGGDPNAAVAAYEAFLQSGRESA